MPSPMNRKTYLGAVTAVPVVLAAAAGAAVLLLLPSLAAAALQPARAAASMVSASSRDRIFFMRCSLQMVSLLFYFDRNGTALFYGRARKILNRRNVKWG